jgi:SP family myo-inositol transporter-like MFS transporter 13
MPDTATEPLIADERELPRNGYEDSISCEEDGENAEAVDESRLVAPGAFIWGLTICVGVSGLLFGYEYVDLYPFRAKPFV